MTNMIKEPVNSIPAGITFKVENNPKRLLPGPSNHFTEADRSPISKQSKANSVLSKVKKLRKIVEGKLTLGAKIVQEGGTDKVFRRIFSVQREEKLLTASQCCLLTKAGPIEGTVFISTDSLAFCSDKPILKLSSSNEEPLRLHYKVMIPLVTIKKVSQSKSMKRPSQKYIQVVTVDNFEFCFMGFQSHKNPFRGLQNCNL